MPFLTSSNIINWNSRKQNKKRDILHLPSEVVLASSRLEAPPDSPMAPFSLTTAKDSDEPELSPRPSRALIVGTKQSYVVKLFKIMNFTGFRDLKQPCKS